MKSGLSRRGFLRGLGIGVGAAVGARIPGAQWIGEAHAAGEPASVVILHLVGGFNAMFASADGLAGSFGLDAGNRTPIGNGLVVDKTLADGLPDIAKQRMAAVGVRHGISSHPAAQQALWSHESKNAGLVLADAIGGTASIKAAVCGRLIDEAPRTAVNGVSFQSITDMQKTIDALGGGAPNPRVPDRAVSLAGMEGAHAMSGNALAASPASLETMTNGYKAAIDTLKQPVKKLSFADLKTAYGLGNSAAVRDFKSKVAAAELMVSAGANVVSLFDGGWDSHGDRGGDEVRNKMTSYVLGPLSTFLARMLSDQTRNVTLAIIGDFSRSLPGSDHQPNLSALVFGRNVKQGTTGRTNADVALPSGTPSVQGFWSLLQSVSKSAASPFGVNQHASLAL